MLEVGPRDPQRDLGCAWKLLIAPVTLHCHHGVSNTAQTPLAGAQAPFPLAFLTLRLALTQKTSKQSPISTPSLHHISGLFSQPCPAHPSGIFSLLAQLQSISVSPRQPDLLHIPMTLKNSFFSYLFPVLWELSSVHPNLIMQQKGLCFPPRPGAGF